MKNMKRSVALLVAIALLIGCAAGGTMAWLTTQTGAIENTFTVGDINITLAEGDDLDLKMVPGKKITKDPKVTVEASSEACWLFVKIVETNLATGNDYDYFTYTIGSGWTPMVDTNTDNKSDNGIYYRKVSTSTVNQEFPVLLDNEVIVSEKVTKTDMSNATTDTPKLTFTAYAVQSENLDYTGASTDTEKAAKAWALVP